MVQPAHVLLICTDRLNHKRTELNHITVAGDGTVVANFASLKKLHADKQASECAWVDDHGHLRALCPRCGRNPDVPPARFLKIVDALIPLTDEPVRELELDIYLLDS